MKRIKDIIYPFLSIIFGALLLLYYLNWLSFGGAGLAIGIIALLFSTYYLVIGILDVIMKGLLNKKLFSIISVCAYPLLMFLLFLFTTINLANNLGPNGWVINILNMVAALLLPITYIFATFANSDSLKRVSQLFGMIFVLSLIINVLFDAAGDPITLGQIDVVGLAIYLLYSFMLFSYLSANKNKVENQKNEA